MVAFEQALAGERVEVVAPEKGGRRSCWNANPFQSIFNRALAPARGVAASLAAALGQRRHQATQLPGIDGLQHVLVEAGFQQALAHPRHRASHLGIPRVTHPCAPRLVFFRR